MASKEYKVWIEVEEYDPDIGRFTNLDLPFSSTRTFDNLDDAEVFANELDVIAGSINLDEVKARNANPGGDDDGTPE